MLQSPGHSPRYISPSSTPSSVQTLTLDHSATATATAIAISDVLPRKRGSVVLDEDTYVAAIDRIIERDFFPDIPKLRDRLDWLEAVRSGDPVVIRDAQLKIIERRRSCSRATSVAPGSTAPRSVSRSATPLPFSSATPFGTDRTLSGSVAPAAAAGGADPFAGVNVSLSLDDFFRRYTSEDNESFSRIMEKVNKRRKERWAHLLEGCKKTDSLTLGMEKKDRITDGFGTSGQPTSTLESWNFTAKNLLMYNSSEREDAPLTDEELAERLKGLTKEINRTNTRFHGKYLEESSAAKEKNPVAILYAPVPGTSPAAWPVGLAEKSKKYDLEDLRKTPNPFYVEFEKKSENGYSFVRTPSPAPGINVESPFVTWGEIEGTPLRLDSEDAIIEINGSEGPRFRIPCPAPRDVKAHSLSREASKKIRERSKMFQKPPLPSPSRVRSASPSIRTLSPAAQKFVKNAIAKSSHSVDETLRASYRGASPFSNSPKVPSRLSREGSLESRSPSKVPASVSPW